MTAETNEMNVKIEPAHILLVESLVFQELTKFIYQNFLNYSIHYYVAHY